jgi:hypothetical protein
VCPRQVLTANVIDLCALVAFGTCSTHHVLRSCEIYQQHPGSVSSLPPSPARSPRPVYVASADVRAGRAGRTVVVYGGRSLRAANPLLQDAWALDVKTGRWWPVATGRYRAPGSRMFNADAAGGAVLTDGGGQEWLCIVGGKREPGYRDNETWLLGPLGAACEAASWVWRQVQADGRDQSHARPEARFHHTLTSVDLRQRPHTDPCRGTHLVILGGHDRTISPIASMWILSLGGVVLGSSREEDLVAGAGTPRCNDVAAPACRATAAGALAGVSEPSAAASAMDDEDEDTDEDTGEEDDVDAAPEADMDPAETHIDPARVSWQCAPPQRRTVSNQVPGENDAGAHCRCG